MLKLSLIQKANMRKLLGISFDGISISGIIMEFIKLASVFKKAGFTISLDLGYQIRPWAENDRRPVISRYLPDWIRVTNSTFSTKSLSQYYIPKTKILEVGNDPRFMTYLQSKVKSLVNYLSEYINSEAPDVVVIENGTLPENVVFSFALREALLIYLQKKKPSLKILWRDHDLMWTNEPWKYPKEPYANICLPIAHKSIQYVVTQTNHLKTFSQLCPKVRFNLVRNVFIHNKHYVFLPLYSREIVKRKLGIKSNSYLILRNTRLDPSKRIERDLYLLFLLLKLQPEFLDGKIPYLVITGYTGENIDYANKIKKLAKSLGLINFIVYTDGLAPYPTRERLSTADLLAASDLCIFFTSKQYEGFGNPIGDASAMKIPWCATNYDMFSYVYGDLGFKGLLLDPGKNDDALPNEKFIKELDFFIKHKDHYVDINFKLAEKYFSSNNLNKIIRKII